VSRVKPLIYHLYDRSFAYIASYEAAASNSFARHMAIEDVRKAHHRNAAYFAIGGSPKLRNGRRLYVFDHYARDMSPNFKYSR